MRYECPSCKTPVVWDEQNPFRPFCSEQCKHRDYLGWANEEHVLTSEADTESWSE